MRRCVQALQKAWRFNLSCSSPGSAIAHADHFFIDNDFSIEMKYRQCNKDLEDSMHARTDEAAIPLYEQVKRQISEAVLQGVLASGDVLPGEVALAKEYGVAVGTVRRALADLTLEGMVSRQRRTGTVVTGRMPQHSLRFFYQYFRLHRSNGALAKSVTTILSLRRSLARSPEATEFGLSEASELIQIHRLRSVDGQPVMHETINLSAARLPEFPGRTQDVPHLLYLHLLDRYGIRISAVREIVTAEIASADDRKLLALKAPAAVLVIDARAYDQSGELCITSRHRAATGQFSYVNEIR
jgi:GntR family transcriptional regulator